MATYEVVLPKNPTISGLNLMKLIDPTTNVQETWKIEEHAKWHHRDVISNLQTMGNSAAVLPTL